MDSWSAFIVTLPERRANVARMVRDMDLPNAHVVEAVRSKDLDYRTLEKAGFKHPAFDLPLSKYAVELSHRKALEACVASGASRCLILEDDVDGAGTAWQEVEVPEDADIFFYGRCWDDPATALPAGPGLVRTFAPKCRHAMNVKASVARALLAGSSHLVDHGGDHTLAKACGGWLRCYASSPPVVYQSRHCSACKKSGQFPSRNALPKVETSFDFVARMWPQGPEDFSEYSPMRPLLRLGLALAAIALGVSLVVGVTLGQRRPRGGRVVEGR
jgi:hypothetical protein